MCPLARVPSVGSSSREEKRRPVLDFILMGKVEVLWTHVWTIGRMIFGYNIRNARASIVMENEWPSHEQLTALVHFSAKVLFP